MLIWADFKINKVHLKIEEEIFNKKNLGFESKFTIFILEEQGWIYDSESITCSKFFKDANDLEKILINLEVPEDGIDEILSEKQQYE